VPEDESSAPGALALRKEVAAAREAAAAQGAAREAGPVLVVDQPRAAHPEAMAELLQPGEPAQSVEFPKEVTPGRRGLPSKRVAARGSPWKRAGRQESPWKRAGRQG
jgi:hypothetical protein